MKTQLASIDHRALLARYGVDASAALPALTVCPLCSQAALTVYADTVWRQPWFTCSACEHRSDALGIVASRENLTPAGAAIELRHAGLVDVRGRGALRNTVQASWRYRRLLTLWDLGTQPPEEQLAAEVSTRAGADVRHHWAALRLSELVRQVVPADAPPELAKLARQIGGVMKRPRLVSPLEDLPYRVAALYELRETVNPCRPCVNEQSLLLGFGATLAVAANTTIVVLPDIEAALVRQLRGRMVLRRPPPVVGIVLREIPNEYLRQFRERLVLSAPRATPALLREAAASDLLVHCGPSPQAPSDMAWAAQVRRNARPWQAHARDYLVRAAPVAALAFLREIRLAQDQLSALLKDLPPATRTALQPYFTGEQTLVEYGRWHIRVSGGHVYNGGQHDLAANVVLRITQITTERGREVYRGTLELPSGRRVRFIVPAAQLHRDTYAWLVHFMWRRALGVPFVAVELRPHLVPIAILLGNAEPVQAAPPVGWQAEHRRLVLGRYALGADGDVTTVSRQGRVPGDIARPIVMTTTAATTLLQSPYWPAIFDTATYVASVGLRGLLGAGAMQPLVLCGRGAPYLATLARDGFGCCPVRLGRRDLKTAAKHSWPVVIYVGHVKPEIPPQPYVTHNIIMFTRHAVRLQFMLDNPDCALAGYDFAQTPPPSDVLAYATDLLPAFFAHLARTGWGGDTARTAGTSPLQRARALLWRFCVDVLGAKHNPPRSISRAPGKYLLREMFGSIERQLGLGARPTIVPIATVAHVLQARYRRAFDMQQIAACGAAEELIQVVDSDTWRLSNELWSHPRPQIRKA